MIQSNVANFGTWWFNKTCHVGKLEQMHSFSTEKKKKNTEDKIEIEDTQQHFHIFFEDWLLSWWGFDDLRHMRMLENEPEQRWNRMVEAWSWMTLHHCLFGSFIWIVIFGGFSPTHLQKSAILPPNGVGSSSPKLRGENLKKHETTSLLCCTWNSKQPVFYGCFNWMIPNHYIKMVVSPNIH